MQNDVIESNLVAAQIPEDMARHLHWLAAIRILIASTAGDDKSRDCGPAKEELHPRS